ncbi:MAG: hypothetical protein ACT4OZ_06055 [Gemmatimonadota bacterium]
MRSPSFGLLLLGASLVGAGSATHAQGSDTAATEVVRRYLEAVRSQNWIGCALLTHPDELSRIRRDFLPVFARDSSGQMARRLLGVPTQLRIESLDSVDFAARLFANFVAESAPGTAYAVFQNPEIPGSFPLGSDSSIVVYRFRLPPDSLPLRSWQTKLVRRYGREWRIDMIADFSGLLRLMRGRP